MSFDAAVITRQGSNRNIAGSSAVSYASAYGPAIFDTVFIVDACDVRGGKQAGTIYSTVSGTVLNTVGAFLFRDSKAKTPDALFFVGINADAWPMAAGRESKGAPCEAYKYVQGLRAGKPVMTPDGKVSARDLARHIKGLAHHWTDAKLSAELRVMTLADAYMPGSRR